MGHLINPIGFRLANKNLKEQYVPLYTDSNIRKSVNNLYEVQLYVKQFFKHGIFQKSGFIFSHFHLYETIKDLTLVLFIYAPDLILSSKYNYVRYLDYVSKKKFINFKRPRVYYTRHPLFAHISSFTRRPTELTTFWYSQAVLDDAKMRLLLKFEKSDFKVLHEATSAFFKYGKFDVVKKYFQVKRKKNEGKQTKGKSNRPGENKALKFKTPNSQKGGKKTVVKAVKTKVFESSSAVVNSKLINKAAPKNQAGAAKKTSSEGHTHAKKIRRKNKNSA